MKKHCQECDVEKEKYEFNIVRKNKDGRDGCCRDCRRAKRRLEYAKGGEHVKRAEYAALYRKEHRENAKKYLDNYDRASPRRMLHGSLRRALQRRPTENAVTISDLMAMFVGLNGCCSLSGLEMTWGARAKVGKPSLTSISIDRIDSSKGYSKGNVRLICHGLNALRGAWSDGEALVLAEAFVSFQRRGVASVRAA